VKNLTSRCAKFAAVLFLLSFLVGCASLEAAGTRRGLVLNSTSLQWRSIPVGKSSVKTVTIFNRANARVTITGASVNSPDFQIAAPSLPVTISPLQSIQLNIQYSPGAAGASTATIMISSNSATTPSMQVNVSGTATAPATTTTSSPGQLTAQPASLSFGSVTVGSKQTISGSVTNSGGTALTITQGSLSPATFTLSGLSYPFTLAPGQSASFTATFAPTQGGAQSGSISMSATTASSVSSFRYQVRRRSSATLQTLNIAVGGTGLAGGQLAVSTTSLNFGSVITGQSQNLSGTISNSGGTAITVNQAAVTGNGFAVNGMTIPMTLAPGQSANFNVAFAPKAVGAATGTLSITSSAANTVPIISLSGTAVSPAALTPSPASLSFGNVVLGNNKKLGATLTNSGGAALTITQFTITGAGFAMDPLNTPMTIPVGQSATLNVTFTPQSSGNASGSVAMISNGSPANLSLSGIGSTAGSLRASSSNLAFGTTQTGTSQTLSDTITNSGGASVTISQASVSGTGFSMSGTSLPVTLAPGQSTNFAIKFAPTATGTDTGSVVITSDGSNPTLSIAFSGTASGPGELTPSPSSLSFGNVQTSSSGTQSETLKNSGQSNVTITQASASGAGFSVSGLSLPLTLVPGQSFTFGVQFAPQSTGTINGSLVVTSNADVSNLTVVLSGNGTSVGQLAMNPASLSFGNVTVGTTEQLGLKLTASGSSVTISSLAPSTSEFSISGPALPMVIPAGQSASFAVTFSPQASGSASATLSVVSDAVSSPALALLGTGAAPPQHSVGLSWAPSQSTVAGYYVYRTTTSGKNYAKLNSALALTTEYSDSPVQSGQTYYYVTTAVDSSGKESSYSNEVQAVVPAP
jgi:centrosomal CEP192-like protein/HYDIN/CFA65/VesB family protein/ASPM-SPD-2-Hydin domain-containing protein